jgi:hypothetical protein
VRTAGPQIVKLAAVAGIKLDKAQRMIAGATAGVDRAGQWSAFECVIFAPRQNIKTEYLLARILAGLCLFREELIVYSAHQARTTAKTFRRLKRAIERSPELGARIARVSNRAGAETIELATGQAVECVARSTGSGRGFTGDCVILDEAQDLDGEQLAAILPMLSTRRNPQVLYALSLGNENSTHLGALRQRALARADPHVCWIEWSMAEGDRIDDRDVWKRCNPAVAAGRITMDYLEREFLALGLDQFARERLGKSNWPADETGRFAVISRQAWQACEDPAANALAARPVCFGAAVSRDGRTAAIAACGGGRDARPVIEVVDWRPGEGCAWVGPRLTELASRYDPAAVCWDDDSLAGPLGLATFTGRAKVVNPRPAELAAACGSFMFTFEDRAARHNGDVRLAAAVGAARIRPSRSAWYWDDRGYAAELLQAGRGRCTPARPASAPTICSAPSRSTAGETSGGSRRACAGNAGKDVRWGRSENADLRKRRMGVS